MLQRQGEMGLREIQSAINQAALVKSEFYTQVREEIKEAIARHKSKVGEDGKPVFKDGDAVMVENTTDEMIAAIFSIGMRGSKIGQVQDKYIGRIERGAYYSRVLEKHDDTQKFAEHLKERTRIDVAIVVKNILPDMTRMQTPIFPARDPMADFVGTGGAADQGYPQLGSGFMTQEQLDESNKKR